MASLLTVALVAASGLWTQPAVERASTAVHLRVDQPGGLSAKDLRRVIDEVRAIWTPAGLEITSGGYRDPVPPRAALVSLRLVAAESRKGDRPILGWVTPGVHEALVPILFVSWTGVRGLIAPLPYKGKPLNQLPGDLRDRLTAQAIGRVAAHELGHYLLRSNAHADGGLMRPVYTTTDLTGQSVRPFQIRPDDWTAARREISRLAEAQTR